LHKLSQGDEDHEEILSKLAWWSITRILKCGTTLRLHHILIWCGDWEFLLAILLLWIMVVEDSRRERHIIGAILAWWRRILPHRELGTDVEAQRWFFF
jgi:hypothetical protein